MPGSGARCTVCGAPPLLGDGRCAFCLAELVGWGDDLHLVPYLAERLPFARVRRSGFLGRGPIREVALVASGQRFSARIRRHRLQLRPELTPAHWVGRLLGSLGLEARSRPEVRAALARAGWVLRFDPEPPAED
ncbi:MAG TPA: hypothetical protein VNI34_08580 [Candidatus Nitrosotalea sp.]|nr:hypothetical protein [Candidatus Nitrosotalea sp.]